MALFVPGLLFSSNQNRSVGALGLNGLRYVLGLFLPLWYLNLPRVKSLFLTGDDLPE